MANKYIFMAQLYCISATVGICVKFTQNILKKNVFQFYICHCGTFEIT